MSEAVERRSHPRSGTRPGQRCPHRGRRPSALADGRRRAGEAASRDGHRSGKPPCGAGLSTTALFKLSCGMSATQRRVELDHGGLRDPLAARVDRSARSVDRRGLGQVEASHSTRPAWDPRRRPSFVGPRRSEKDVVATARMGPTRPPSGHGTRSAAHAHPTGSRIGTDRPTTGHPTTPPRAHWPPWIPPANVHPHSDGPMNPIPRRGHRRTRGATPIVVAPQHRGPNPRRAKRMTGTEAPLEVTMPSMERGCRAHSASSASRIAWSALVVSVSSRPPPPLLNGASHHGSGPAHQASHQ